ncbi:leucine-rich repeat and immunoglobulin-like domain-containing nogo receptor-interacting protein 3 [Sipha flava]|uniref:Immunoglobulin superfamily containing leucine-rich repeat protein n=1 Tax=Sipha flava TaxID=143950 RepID=A0A2S2R7J8_9HEMI|nr:leucine-rich repeat and immunoglobulin-like domain-containing nogo receptor-interacting protein 3 [Sipha flava]
MRGGRPVQLIVMVLVCCYGGLAFADWADCPSPCQCKWSSGKKTALCKDAELTDVPTQLDGDMQVLDLSANSIRVLPAEAFKRVGLLNLQRVFMRGCGLHDVHRDAFRELKILVELDLSDNLIGSLHPKTFHGNERLRVLYLNGNPLTEVGEAQFPVLQHLRTLELQHCQIKRVHRDAFLHLSALESLNLNGNLLKQLSETVFLSVAKLKTLSLDGNPWVCDCRLRSFRNWLVTSNLYSHPLSCTEPVELSGSRWENVQPDEFACPPTVRIDRDNVLEDAGSNVSFTCKVTGDPEPEVSWYFNGHGVDNYTDRMDENRTWLDSGDGGGNGGRTWTALTVFNVSDVVAGEYTCEASNSRGRATANVTLALPEVAVATTLSKSRSVYVMMVCAAASVAALLFVAGLACCVCHVRKSSRGQRAGKAAFKGSTSFSDADKRLLDASISTTQAGSCEMLGGGAEAHGDGGGSGSGSGGSSSGHDLELVEQSLHNIPLAAVCDQQPVHITIESHDHCNSGVSVYPPPPEFSTSILPSVSGYGNIFISVSVSQEPPDPESRYPDLLDMQHRQKQNVSVATGTNGGPAMGARHREVLVGPGQSSYYATVPRKNRLKDNGHHQHQQHQKNHQQHQLQHHRPSVKSVAPHYDNMGPRITVTGSCTNLSSLVSSSGGSSSDDIPPPPPPPLCTGHTDYVAL